MTTLFQKAFDDGWLTEQMQTAAGVAITYTRSPTALTLTAVLGRTVFASNAEGGAKIQFGDGDFLIKVTDLSALTVPRIGDVITLTLNGETATFEVAQPATGEPEWRWSDPEQTEYRIHTKWKPTS